MVSGISADRRGEAVSPVAGTVRRTAKIMVTGGFGVGKTTLIGAVSEITPLRTEEVMTAASNGVDDLKGLDGKTTTTVALDFGRITFGDLALYVYGTPGQRRFWDLWAGLAEGAIGVLVLVDTRRLAESFHALDQLEQHGQAPLVVGVNHFPDTLPYPHSQLRDALGLDERVPIVDCRAPDRGSALNALIAVVDHAIDCRNRPPAPEGFPR